MKTLEDREGVIGGKIQGNDIGNMVSSFTRVKASKILEFEGVFIIYFLFDSFFLDYILNIVMFSYYALLGYSD